MAVYTEVSLDEASDLMSRLQLGQLLAMQGIQGGIENTNYFVTTDDGQGPCERVLTVFERLNAEQLPYYLRLMQHLANHGLPVPKPEADARGNLVHPLQGKPAAVVNKLAGKSVLQPEPSHCATVGGLLAQMHLAGRDFVPHQANLRGLSWWNETVPVVLPFLKPDQSALLRAELAYQNHLATLSAYQALPRGPIHADLFRDNVLFVDDKMGGFFDFYFAGDDSFVFDLAVCLNDWCIRHGGPQDGQHDAPKAEAFLRAYESVRPLTGAERGLLSPMLRAAALRFWLSRLWDLHLPREASLLQAHDPTHFERVLRHRVGQAICLPEPQAA